MCTGLSRKMEDLALPFRDRNPKNIQPHSQVTTQIQS